MKLLKYALTTLTTLYVLNTANAFAQNFSFTYSRDSRDYHGLKMEGFSKLQHGLNLSGFMDIDSKPGEKDLSKFYLEPRITRTGFFKEGDDLVSRILNSLGVVGEYNGSEKENDDNYRFGLASNNKIKGMTINFKYLPLNSKKSKQLSVFFNKNNKNWYIAGFIDYNIVDGKNKVLSEVWGGHRINF